MAKTKSMGKARQTAKAKASNSTTSKSGRVVIEPGISYDTPRDLYYVTFYHGKDPDTKKPIRDYGTFKRLQDARDALKEFKAQKAKDNVPAPTLSTVREFAEHYIDRKRVEKKETATMEDYRKFMDKLIAYPKFADKKLRNVKPEDANDYIKYLENTAKLHNNTVRKHFAFFNSVFTLAFDEGRIARNPMRTLKKPPKVKTCAKAMDEQTAAQYVNAAKGKAIEPMILLGLSGLRRGELAGLRWEHVDFEKSIIRVAETRVQSGNTVETKMPKTEDSVRLLYMPDYLKEVLLRVKKAQKVHDLKKQIKNMNHLYVIGKADGSPYRPNYLDTMLKRFIKDNNLPAFRLHDHRHTAASISHAIGYDMYDISKFLGHSNIGTTADLYTHQFDKANSALHTDLINRITTSVESDSPAKSYDNEDS